MTRNATSFTLRDAITRAKEQVVAAGDEHLVPGYDLLLKLDEYDYLPQSFALDLRESAAKVLAAWNQGVVAAHVRHPSVVDGQVAAQLFAQPAENVIGALAGAGCAFGSEVSHVGEFVLPAFEAIGISTREKTDAQAEAWSAAVGAIDADIKQQREEVASFCRGTLGVEPTDDLVARVVDGLNAKPAPLVVTLKGTGGSPAIEVPSKPGTPAQKTLTATLLTPSPELEAFLKKPQPETPAPPAPDVSPVVLYNRIAEIAKEAGSEFQLPYESGRFYMFRELAEFENTVREKCLDAIRAYGDARVRQSWRAQAMRELAQKVSAGQALTPEEDVLRKEIDAAGWSANGQHFRLPWKLGHQGVTAYAQIYSEELGVALTVPIHIAGRGSDAPRYYPISLDGKLGKRLDGVGHIYAFNPALNGEG